MENSKLSIAELKNAIKTFRSIFGNEKALVKCAVITNRYFKESKVLSLSANDLSSMLDIEKEYAFKILIKLNSDYFKNKQGA